MKTLSRSTLQLSIVSLSLLVLLASFYLQYVKGFEPCPLCLMQRVSIIFILAFGLINFYRKSSCSQALFVTQYILALLGIYFAARQMWLMSLPSSEIPACLPGLSVLVHYFPWHETVRALVWGSGNCTEIRWTWLGLSIPAWSIVYFVCVAIATVMAYFRPKKDQTNSA